MKRVYPEQPIVGVGAVIVQGDRVLLVRRGNEPLRDQWSIPGGVLELGETLRQGAAREAREETGLVVEPGEVLDAVDSIHRDEHGRPRYHYVLIDLLCRVRAGELRAASDVSEARWFTAEELATIQVPEPAAGVLRKGLRRARETGSRQK
jgi:8-oxo-dGTP diphosphatase